VEDEALYLAFAGGSGVGSEFFCRFGAERLLSKCFLSCRLPLPLSGQSRLLLGDFIFVYQFAFLEDGLFSTNSGLREAKQTPRLSKPRELTTMPFLGS
jgi:hypothetical protein